ncbi:21 kDa protein-like [Curcuma longa]|uniref:21 kDa protein-like n=1 Tax=Curcuma longa TaxID=136217 RepID=UPI003D9ED1D2
MESQGAFIVSTFLFFFLAGCRSTQAAGVGNSTEFIREACAGTLYPRLCFSSLVGYAAVVQRSDVRLSQVASNVTLARVRSASANVSATLARAGPAAGPRLRAALRDCSDVLRDAAARAGQAAEALRAVESAAGPALAWQVSNALTWMSAALTDEDTCADGLATLAAPTAASGGDSTTGEVYLRVREVEKHTSIALAFIHKLGF